MSIILYRLIKILNGNLYILFYNTVYIMVLIKLIYTSDNDVCERKNMVLNKYLIVIYYQKDIIF